MSKKQRPRPDFMHLALPHSDETPYTGTLCSLLEESANPSFAKGKRQAAVNAAAIELATLLLDEFWIGRYIELLSRIIEEGKLAESAIHVLNGIVKTPRAKGIRSSLGMIFRRKLRKIWGPVEAPKKKRKSRPKEGRLRQGEMF